MGIAIAVAAASVDNTDSTELNCSSLAEQSGLGRTQVWRILKGYRQPSWEAACKLADAMGLTLDEFRSQLPAPMLEVEDLAA